jgi:F0F1-type ATP synthase membrane subunit b/b'
MFFFTPDFWVAVSFFVFVGVLIKMGVPSMITKALDDRQRLIAVIDDLAVDDDLFDTFKAREFKHGVEQDAFKD